MNTVHVGKFWYTFIIKSGNDIQKISVMMNAIDEGFSFEIRGNIEI